MRRLLAFGAIKPYKGLDILMNAFALLPEDLKRTTRLWVVGEPSLGADEVYAMGHHWGVSDFVDYDLRFVPDQELGCIFAASDAVIFPYRRIDASGVLMLVLPFAKPIVATSVGCFAELLRNHDHALLVPPEDPAALAQALEQVLRHPEESKQMAERARTLAQDTMSWSRIAEMTDETYRAAFRPRTSLLFGRARKLASRKVRPA
jgi:glycosyltransferase involved in cell wall biosynthesis